MNAWLVVLVIAVNFLPEAIAAAGWGTRAAWEFVAYGAEAAALWGIVLQHAPSLPLKFAAAYGFVEAAERPLCRLSFPMTRAPALAPDQTLCDAATGLPISLLSVLAALFVASMAQEYGRA